jgi:hypothetical protein
MIQERVEDQLTRSAKSPLTLLHHGGVKPPLPKGGQAGFNKSVQGIEREKYESKRNGEIHRRFLQRQESAEGPWEVTPWKDQARSPKQMQMIRIQKDLVGKF